MEVTHKWVTTADHPKNFKGTYKMTDFRVKLIDLNNNLIQNRLISVDWIELYTTNNKYCKYVLEHDCRKHGVKLVSYLIYPDRIEAFVDYY